jgi:[protein-PII] uridylyltransferase
LPHYRPRIEIDNDASTQSTLIQVVAQDGPGLLRQIAKSFSKNQCNIEVALIDTEGEIAIDVFYLTSDGKKLGEVQQKKLASSITRGIDRLRA